MSISKDILWKGIIENLVDDFIWYFFPNYVEKIDFERGFEFLDTELQKLIPDNPGQNRHADKLIRVWLKDGLEAWFLIHVEVQGYQDIQFAARMFEYMYRIRDKYQQPVTGLAIYTDWNRRYHYTQFTETFLGTEVIYRFNTYVLRDHTPEILAQDANPFAAVMEAAWQQLGKKKTDDQLYSTKLDLIKRLLKRKVSRKKIVSIINFIKYFVPFTNSENLLKFEQDLNQLIKADQPMGIEEAILEEVKQQGIELGETKFKEELLKHAVPELTQLGLEAEKIAAILDLELEAVRKVIEEGMQG
ncbi:hypothetical protein [Haliscomenobacter hydrossis]|uniref:Transposase (putative) YhgA-like domain-containing protein n=1 Tax=Haliscomenobacter hydrossis (strain ATCC 27775 / DSM 1100 / LMG 10767 / O) TaxID=760192 RepID=F4KYU3_HALH1|nr:hypothetical protein [Haliscomenobacter hydrossis]AEE51485.1 hypothetical protein Halhy_3633 [Haliscomenobacter hydrossis DSM 1100]